MRDENSFAEENNAASETQHREKLHLNGERFVNIAFHVWRQFDDPYYAGFAAQIAYFFFMASVPTLIVLSQVLGFFDLSLDMIKTWMENHIDEHVSHFVSGLFSASSVQLSNFVMIVLAVWAASALEFSLARLTSYTLTEGSYRFNFWTERLKAIPTSLVAIVTVAFALIVYVYGEELFVKVFHSGVLTKALVALRMPIVAALFFAMILLNYYILPRIRVPLRAVLPGAVFASAGITTVTAIYSLYIGYLANYDILYGSFATIVALMLWFYLISWVLCLGMMFNKAWDDIMQRNRLTQEKMIEYIEKQRKADAEGAYRKYLIPDDGAYDEHDESIAVKMSKIFVKGYEEEWRREQEHKNRRRL